MADLTGYTELKRRFAAIGMNGRTAPFMRALGLAAVREQKLLVHRKTGNTGRTIKVEAVSDTSVTTSAGGAAVYLELGTRAHEITPKARMALRFAPGAGGARLSGRPRAGAAVVFAKRVHHPGSKAYPFMVPGAQKALANADNTIGPLVDRWNGAA